jgi:nucleoside-diphosphate-sugar epimerase
MKVAQRIFLAGAAGAVGTRLIPLLRGAGHTVVGTTRSPAKAAELRSLGAEPVIVDVFDAPALLQAVKAARATVVIHQLTDLPKDLDPQLMPAAVVRNARVRREGTHNLVAAALAANARRFIAQSILWAYAPGTEPHSESDPLDTAAAGDRAVSVRGVMDLEAAVLSTPQLEGVILRYGYLYGPGTHADKPGATAPLHVDAAAYAALLAIDRGSPGVFNIAAPNSYATTTKAARELGWNADFRSVDPATRAAGR